MTPAEICSRRLRNLQVSHSAGGTPADVVRRLAAVQSQDYAGAKWSLGLRLEGAGDADVERAYNEGAILRTHLLRPTWHFVTPEDIRWLLLLTGPRIQAANAGQYRRLELDAAALKKCRAVLAGALEGGNALTRDELRAALNKARIPTDVDNRLAYIMMAAELDGLIASGPRRGKQFTYALLEERARPAKTLRRDEALVELARRFFATRGPATAHDFAKWSGLTVTDARAGLAAVADGLESETVGTRELWFPPGRAPRPKTGHTAYLLSIYDEYISSYRDRSDIGAAEYGPRLVGMGNALQFIVILDGRVVGTWKRAISAKAADIAITPFRKLSPGERRAVTEAARRYGDFLKLPVHTRGLDFPA